MEMNPLSYNTSLAITYAPHSGFDPNERVANVWKSRAYATS